MQLRKIDALYVAKATADHWGLRYGVPGELLLENGSQFASKFFIGDCDMMGITNNFTRTYHTQTNGKSDMFNCTILKILW